MKKVYIQPTAKSIVMATRPMMAGSVHTDGSDVKHVTTGGDFDQEQGEIL